MILLPDLGVRIGLPVPGSADPPAIAMTVFRAVFGTGPWTRHGAA